MKSFESAVAIGVTSYEHGSAEFIITHDNRLVMLNKTPRLDVTIDMGVASKRRINFLIECLERIKLHGSDE